MSYKTASPDRYALLKECARENRRNATLAESVFEPQQQGSDKLREEELERMGYHMLRFSNEEVLNDIDTVLNEIDKYFNEHR